MASAYALGVGKNEMEAPLDVTDQTFENEGFRMSDAQPDVYIIQRAYSLSLAEFNGLTQSDHPLRAWALSLGLGSLIPLLLFVGKHAYHKVDDTSPKVENWEWVSVGGVTFLSLVLWLIASALPSEKKSIKKKIQEYFSSNEHSFFSKGKDGSR